MHFNLQTLWTVTVYFYLMIIGSEGLKSDVLVTELAKHMIRENLRVRSVTIVSRSPIENLPGLSLRLVRQILSGFPSLFITDTTDRQRYSSSRWLLMLRPQRSVLNVVLAEKIEGKNIIGVLLEHLDFLVEFTPRTTRAKCAFIFVHETGGSLDFEEFFRYAWTQKFLNIVLIEVIGKKSSFKLLMPSHEYQAVLHQYNPFTEVYRRSEFPREIDTMFVDKLRDLQGYPLKFGLFDDIPMVLLSRNDSSGRDIWDVAQGLDVLVTKTLFEAMNFTAVVEVIDSDNPAWRVFNASDEFIDDAIKSERIDFSVNFYGIIGSTPVEDLFFEPR